MNELQVFPEGALEEISYIDGLIESDKTTSINNVSTRVLSKK